MNIIEWSYISYIAITIPLVIWVAKTLHKNGKVFLVDCFHGNKDLAESVNHLLVVGFYLMNLGMVALFLKTNSIVEDLRGGIELASEKLGTVMLVLGVMHFFNIYLFNKIRKRESQRSYTPPRQTIPKEALAKLSDAKI
ncbi:hypothetical protein OAB00_00420 [Akkermansiaceae bacterium]|nr:hypothetical protein [Akkermansiaceae bacterium]